jgi:transcription initiation factor TFIIE subunit alpha
MATKSARSEQRTEGQDGEKEPVRHRDGVDRRTSQERLEGGIDWVPTLEDQVIRGYITEHAGEIGLQLAELIRDNQPVLGVDIVELLPEKPTVVRRAMYKLEEARIAEYEKDTDRTGWETFTWHLTLNEVKYRINQMRQDRLRYLEERLDFEANTEWYACAQEHPRVDFETAMDNQFRCPVCAQPTMNVDNSDQIERLVREIHELKKQVF